MPQVSVRLGQRSYDIHIGSGLLADCGRYITKALEGSDVGKIAIVSDENVAELYLGTVSSSLSKAGFDTTDVVIMPGEQSKCLGIVETTCETLVENGLDRSSVIIALGGGVIGDLAGFVASAFMRGVPYVQIPTSLLAQVDSSVGGKTGVNLATGKNLVGAFWQPSLVVSDVEALRTLSERDFVEGLAEVVKYGVIRDEGFFTWLENNAEAIVKLDRASLEEIVAVSCRIKARVVEEDERESGLRAILNYGHTFAHAFETVSGYGKLRHGEAVSIGMVAAARVGALLDMISADAAARIAFLLKRLGLPVRLPQKLDIERLLDSFSHDKKAIAGRPVFVFPERIGKVRVVGDAPQDVVREVLDQLQRTV